MDAHKTNLERYNVELEEWKKWKLKKLMATEYYRKNNLGVVFDNALTKGTMYKYLFPDIKFTFPWPFDDIDAFNDLSLLKTEPEIPALKKIRNLRAILEKHELAGDLDQIKRYKSAINLETNLFLTSAKAYQLSPSVLEELNTDIQKIIKSRTELLQMKSTIEKLITDHFWFRNIVEEIAEGGFSLTKNPKVEEIVNEINCLTYELEAKRKNGTINLLSAYTYSTNIENLEKTLESANKKFYQEVVSAHFDYVCNTAHMLVKMNFNTQRINSKRQLKQIIKLFAWFYIRLFWWDKKDTRKNAVNERNSKRPKSKAFEQRRSQVQDCKNRGLNKKQTCEETGLSANTVRKYWSKN